jgi:hypothetical protein
MCAGRARLPICEHIKRDGNRCGFHVMKGSTRCQKHTSGKLREELDNIAYEKARIVLDRCGAPTTRKRAAARIRAIEKRRLHRLWVHFPDAAGSTLFLSSTDELSVQRWLKSEGIDLEHAGYTPRGIDYCRWAAFRYLCERIDIGFARREIARTIRKEQAWALKKSSLESFSEL